MQTNEQAPVAAILSVVQDGLRFDGHPDMHLMPGDRVIVRSSGAVSVSMARDLTCTSTVASGT